MPLPSSPPERATMNRNRKVTSLTRHCRWHLHRLNLTCVCNRRWHLRDASAQLDMRLQQPLAALVASTDRVISLRYLTDRSKLPPSRCPSSDSSVISKANLKQSGVARNWYVKS
ncbi:Uncharacterized protein PBTT_03588 [Plasmodiophora brassicae]